MCNITGNHDLTRFISLAGKAVKDDEDQKEAGWARDIKVEDPVGYAKLKMLETFIMTIPGIPVIFYGDEIGMPGANDPDNRRMMRFDGLSSEESDVKEHVSTLTRIRADHMALLFGDVKVLQVDERVMLFARSYLQDHVFVAFNNSSQPREIRLPAHGPLQDLDGKRYELHENGETITLAPYASQIFYTP
jgi:glycosidase